MTSCRTGGATSVSAGGVSVMEDVHGTRVNIAKRGASYAGRVYVTRP